jgi:hypothetical protein
MKALVTLLIASAAFAAQAQTQTPRVDQRQANQDQRIDQGVASGALTQREATRLENQQGRIEKMEDKAKADGDVTKRERAKLHGAQGHASREIARKKHNRREN